MKRILIGFLVVFLTLPVAAQSKKELMRMNTENLNKIDSLSTVNQNKDAQLDSMKVNTGKLSNELETVKTGFSAEKAKNAELEAKLEALKRENDAIKAEKEKAEAQSQLYKNNALKTLFAGKNNVFSRDFLTKKNVYSITLTDLNSYGISSDANYYTDYHVKANGNLTKLFSTHLKALPKVEIFFMGDNEKDVEEMAIFIDNKKVFQGKNITSFSFPGHQHFVYNYDVDIKETEYKITQIYKR